MNDYGGSAQEAQDGQHTRTVLDQPGMIRHKAGKLVLVTNPKGGSKMKNCPFCGHSATRVVDLVDLQGTREYQVMCENCGAWGPNDVSKAKAVEMWNMRRAAIGSGETEEDAR